jgi:hypothetical protein
MKPLLILLAALLVGCDDSYVTNHMIQKSTKLCGESGLKSLRKGLTHTDGNYSVQAICNNDAAIEWRDRTSR